MRNTFFVVILFVWIGCKVDAPLPKQLNCNCSFTDSCIATPALPHTTFSYEPIYNYDSTYFQWPYFNPNNPNEIIYYKSSQLIKYNLITKQKQVLFSGTINRQPVWGREGWILINSIDANGANIYKIKDNGDSLTLLPLSDLNYYPQWNYNGDKFIVEHRVTTSNADYYSGVIYDINGNPTDTVKNMDFTGGCGCWQNKNNLIVKYEPESTSGLSIFNVAISSSETILDIGTSDLIGTFFWYPDGINIIYSDGCGIHTINYQTKETKCLIQQCSTGGRAIGSVSFISNKVLCEKFYEKYTGSQGGSPIFSVTTKLVLMNLDGSGEEVVNLN